MTTITSPVTRSRERDRLLHWAPLAVVLTGVFMAVLDFFIVNVALPQMQRSLHASASSIEWVAAGYALTTAVLLIASGRLGDRYGRRRIFSIGLAAFTLGSAACGVAPNTEVLIAGRLAQGVGGALIATNVLALLGVLYEGADRARAMAAYATVMGFAAVGGQLIGGALVQLDPLGLSWRSCFLINLPIGAAGLLAARRLVPESRGVGIASLDLPGIALITATLTALVLPLVEGRQLGWPLWCWLSLAAVPPLLGTFIVQQRSRRRSSGLALLDHELFRLRSFRAGLLAQTVFWIGQGSFFLILALYLQQGRGLTPLAAGGVFTVLALSYVIAAAQAPALAARHGRDVITLAAALLVAGHLLLIGAVALNGTGGSVLALFPGLLVVGVGMGLAIAPLAGGILATLRPEQAGAAAGALSTAQYVGSAIGVAVVGIVFFGTVHSGFGTAFQDGLWVLVAALSLVAMLSRALP